MRTKLIAAAVIAVSLLSPAAMQAPQAQSTTVGRVIVKYKADSGLMHTQAMTVAGQRLAQMRTLGLRVGAALTAGSDITESSHVVFARGMSSEQLAATLAADSEVEYAVPDRKMHRLSVPNDPFYGTVTTTSTSGGPLVGQWYLKPPGPTGTAAKTAPAGSETAVAMMKSAVAAANSAYDTLSKATKQAVEMTEANVTAATNAAVKTTARAKK